MDQSHSPDISPMMSRRRFLGLIGAGSAALLTASVCAPASREGSYLAASESFTHEINGQLFTFTHALSQENKPYINSDGTAFDISHKQFIQAEQASTARGLLLGQTSFPPRWLASRDVGVTPEFILQNSKMNDIVASATDKLIKWENHRHNNQAGIEPMDESLGTQSHVKVSDIVTPFIPSDLLKIRMITNSLAEALTYKYIDTSPKEFEDLPLSERLDQGYTNCIEFALVSASVYALQGYPSEIMYFGFNHPLKGRIYHVANVLNYQNCAVVADLTLGKDLRPLTEYIQLFTNNDRHWQPNIEYASILADRSYQKFGAGREIN